jgi:hypothetical protein
VLFGRRFIVLLAEHEIKADAHTDQQEGQENAKTRGAVDHAAPKKWTPADPDNGHKDTAGAAVCLQIFKARRDFNAEDPVFRLDPLLSSEREGFEPC